MPAVLLILIAVTAVAPAQPSVAASVPAGAAAIQAGDAYLQFMLGRRLEAGGDIEGAIAAHKRAAELDPRSAEIRAELAGLYARQDRPSEAIEWAEAALKLDAGTSEAHRVLGLVYAAFAERPTAARRIGLGDAGADELAARAIRHLEQADADTLADGSLHFALGRLYVRQRSYQKAIAVFHRLLEQEPGVSEASLLLAEAYEGAGALDDARRTLEEAIAEEPGLVRARLRLAGLFERQEQWSAAAEQYARALDASPGNLELVRHEALAWLRAGEPGRARDRVAPLVARIEEGDRASRQREALLPLLGVAYLELHEYDHAIKTLEQARGIVPNDDSLLLQLGAAYERSGRDGDAERVFRDLLARDPLNAPALNYLGYMLAERGRALDEAVALITRALAREPENPSYLDSLGWAYFKLGRLDLAERHLRVAAGRLVTNSVVQDHLGDLLSRVKRFDEAIAAWQRALSGDGESIDRAKIEAKIREARVKVGRR